VGGTVLWGYSIVGGIALWVYSIVGGLALWGWDCGGYSIPQVLWGGGGGGGMDKVYTGPLKVV
jgi:hypothetical protein